MSIMKMCLLEQLGYTLHLSQLNAHKVIRLTFLKDLAFHFRFSCRPDQMFSDLPGKSYSDWDKIQQQSFGYKD